MIEPVKPMESETARHVPQEKAAVRTFRDLRVYQAAMDTAMRIFELSKRFPPEEKFSLTDQVRRSSRSVCANIAEAWRKRRYEAAFISKLSDAETECAETQVWLEVAGRCNYLPKPVWQEVDVSCEGILGQLVSMMNQTSKWLIRDRK